MNKTAAIFGGNPQNTDIAHQLGYRLIALGFDSMYIGDGANTLISQLTFR
jgi:2-keto-3-deoxy-L-rhamnonate aldolase RhmA